MRKNRQSIDATGSLEPWIALQQELQDRLESSLRERLGPEPAALVRYREDYDRTMPAWTGKLLSPGKLTRRMEAADIILLGDYHSLAQSQRSALRLLKRLAGRGLRPALALESLPAERQAELDAYLARETSERKLLDIFREGWDFPWPPVRTLLRYARYHGLPVIALNSDPTAGRDPLASRDRQAARLIAGFRRENPEQPVLVLFGDFHLCENGLPAALARARCPGRILRIFQNPDPLYWQALAVLGETPGILELAGGDVALQSSTPLMKRQSYHFWLTGQELDQDTVGGRPPTDPGELVADLSEEVDSLLRQMARFLSIPLLELDPPAVIWMGAEDFARSTRDLRHWTPEEIGQVTGNLAWGHGTFLPRQNLALLGKLSQNRVAEMAGRVLHTRCSRVAPRPRTLVDDFYLRVVETALVFLASKIINPFRKYRDIPALRRKLERDDSGKNGWRRRTRLLLGYLEAEEAYLRLGDVEAIPGRFFRQRAHAHLDLTRAVGKHLGGRLYEALMDEGVDRLWLRELYFENFALEGSPTRIYFEILDRIWSNEGWSGADRRAQQL